MYRVITITLILLLSIATFFSFKAYQDKSSPDRPNIVLLLADDMGYGELGSYGQEVIRTPFLDSLATVGLRFTNFYAGSALCAPSRAVLMTGMHTGHTSIRGNRGRYSERRWDRIALDQSELTIGEMLQKEGYQTAMIGKWHLGVPDDKSTWAKKRGFDYAVQEQWGFNNRKKYDERIHWINNNEDSIFYDYNQYKCLDEFRTNFALDYLEKKKRNRPFFLYMSYRIPHAHEFFLSPYEYYDEFKQEWPEIERRHAARITMLDEQIRRLFNALKDKGELENTVIIFTSDNGPHQEHFHKYRFFNSSGGLRGHKRDLYEGGIKVPMIAYWKGRIKEGKTTDHPATFYDFMPTIAELANIQGDYKTDGISFLNELLEKPQPKHEFLYWEIQRGLKIDDFCQAVRLNDWKAVRSGYKNVELFNLRKDPLEKKDISQDYPEIVKEINQIMKSSSNKSKYYPYSGINQDNLTSQ